MKREVAKSGAWTNYSTTSKGQYEILSGPKVVFFASTRVHKNLLCRSTLSKNFLTFLTLFGPISWMVKKDISWVGVIGKHLREAK